MLKSTVALVTGGASGLGKATVERIIQQGGKVVICDLPASDGVNLVRELGPSSLFCPVDVTSESDVQHALKTIKDKFGCLNTVVNCAGIDALKFTYNFKRNIPHDLELFTKTLAVNVVGTFNVIRLSVKLIEENEPNEDGFRGVIINTSSSVAYDGTIGQAAYAASKAAIVGMTLPLSREFGVKGIRVCAIAPGLFDTPLTAGFSDKVKSFILKTVPHPKRVGSPHEYALLVQSILENPFLNGEVIRLDGGFRMPYQPIKRDS